jgi:hypothetical protein
MRYSIFFIFVLSIGLSPLVPYSWSNHKVGDPALEQLPIWNQCCHDHDCVPQKVKIIGKQGREKISVEIEGTPVSVSKEKFHPVPTNAAWVCYFNKNGEISNQNIRCVLYPQQSGTTETPPTKDSTSDS